MRYMIFASFYIYFKTSNHFPDLFIIFWVVASISEEFRVYFVNSRTSMQ
jgi:hypothetical protein